MVRICSACALAVFTLLTWCNFAHAEIKGMNVEYEHDGTVLEGYYVHDDEVTGLRPAVLIIHQWKGLTDYERSRADMLAEMGLVAFCVDVYGKGIRPATNEEAGAEAGKYRGDTALFRGRLNAGLAWLMEQPQVDKNRIAAIGYCFGGGGALELARSGAAISGAVSFHGGFPPSQGDAGNIKAKVLVLHGSADPHAPVSRVNELIDELHAAGVDADAILYGGAVHSFTEQHAGNDPSKGAAYDEDADRRSWQHMLIFFGEIFGV